MDDLNKLFENWDLSTLHEKKKKKNKKTAKDPVFGIAMTWPASDFFGYEHEEKKDEEGSEVFDSGGISVDLGDTGSGGITGLFDAGQAGTATVGGE